MKKTTNDFNPTKKKGYSPKQNRNNYAPAPKSSDLKPKDEVKAFFRSYFAKRNETGQLMSKEDVIKHVLKKLTPQEEEEFHSAVNELKNEGFIAIETDGLSFTLTQKGADSFS